MRVQPAGAHIKHSLFCDPTSSSEAGSRDELDKPLPILLMKRKDSILGGAPHVRSVSRASSNQDKPLPGPPPSTSSDCHSVRSGNPIPVRSNSGATVQPHPTPLGSQPRQSLFPEYDHQLPLSQQPYYPAEPAEARRPQFRRLSSSVSPQSVQSPTSATSFFPSEVPVARLPQLRSLWAVASGDAKGCRTEITRLAMHREVSAKGDTGFECSFGSEEGQSLYSVRTSKSIQNSSVANEMLIRRHHPLNEMVVPIMQLDLPVSNLDGYDDASMEKGTLLFPQTAALNALEAAATSHKAASIAQYDPRASSPQAAQLAYEAVAAAKENEACQLVHSPGGIDSQGSLEHGYKLQHPRLGVFNINVRGRVGLFDGDNNGSKRSSRGLDRISMHYPSEKPSAVPEVLASLDTSAGTLELDIGAMKRLDSRYVVDTVVCALLAVAVRESQRSVAPPSPTKVSFGAPPLSPEAKISKENRASPSPRRSSLGRWRRSLIAKIRRDKPVAEIKSVSEVGPPPPAKAAKPKKLPAITRGLLYLIGFTFEAIVWLLSLGVRVLTKILVGVSSVVSKA